MNAWEKSSCPSRKSFGLLPVLTIIFCMGCAGVLAGEPAARLFSEVPASQLQNFREKEEPSRTVVRSRFVLVNSDSLLGSDAPQGADSIVLNMFEDFSPTAVKDRVEWRSKANYTWFGRIAGEEQSQVILVFKKGNMAGNITIRRGVYQIRAVEDGVHAVREIDQSGFRDEHEPVRVN